MKETIIFLFVIMLVIIPQPSKADVMGSFSLDPNNISVSSGSIFSMTFNINIDYEYFNSCYPLGYSLDWGAGSGNIFFSYDNSVVKLLNNSGDFVDVGGADGGFTVLAGSALTYHPHILNFQALQNGFTNLDISGWVYGDIFYYDPENPSAYKGWVNQWGAIGISDSMVGTIHVTPEPITMLLFGLGMMVLAGARGKLLK